MVIYVCLEQIMTNYFSVLCVTACICFTCSSTIKYLFSYECSILSGDFLKNVLNFMSQFINV